MRGFELTQELFEDFEELKNHKRYMPIEPDPEPEPEPKSRPVPPHTFGTRDMWATSSRAERRAAERAKRKKGRQ